MCFFFSAEYRILLCPDPPDPGYGNVKMPVLQHVKPFAFVNQAGKTITEKEMDGKVYVAEFFLQHAREFVQK